MIDKRDMAQTVASAVAACCGLLAIGATLVWAPPCDGVLELANGNAAPMRCFFTARAIVLLGLCIVALGAFGSLTRRGAAVPLFALGIALVVVTFDCFAGIGVCKSEMACWATAFWTRAAGAAIIACSVLGFALSSARKRVR